jgi:hypothetical protein
MHNNRQNLIVEIACLLIPRICNWCNEISLENAVMSTHLWFLYIFALFTSCFSIHLHKPYKIDEGHW